MPRNLIGVSLLPSAGHKSRLPDATEKAPKEKPNNTLVPSINHVIVFLAFLNQVGTTKDDNPYHPW